ncbi:MAG: RNB domain-containing ribonuclease [Acidimicrobiales bacterium]
MHGPRRHLLIDAALVGPALRALREELSVADDHPPEVLAEAADAARRGPALPPGAGDGWVDATELPLVTVDPAGSRDLDQALHLARRPGGYRVSYAIADVAAFVTPGGAIDREAWRRGTTLYLPDGSARLHPATLSESAASLLADGVVRPALLWQLDLDADGTLRATDVRRALVRSRRQLSYPEAQAIIDRALGGRSRVDGRAPLEDGVIEASPGGLALLAEIGPARQRLEVARGGISLQLPEQDVVVEGGSYRLLYRRNLPVEGWNAQLSLLAGMAAADLMGAAGAGIVRVLPGAEPDALEGLRRRAAALGVAWPAEEPYPVFVRRLDPEHPAEAAVLHQAAKTLRGAGYEVLDAADRTNGVPRHGALAAAYAHVTAPLRRLVDRYAGEVAVALCAGRRPPGWVIEALDGLPAAMAAAGQRSSRVDGAVLDLFEALALQGRVGDRFDATVVDSNARQARVQLRDPAVVAAVGRPLPVGARVTLRLVESDPAARTVCFDAVDR